MQFKELAGLWLKSLEGKRRDATLRTYRFAIQHAVEHMGETELGAITAEMLGELETKLQEKKKSYRTVKIVFNAVRLALGHAESGGLIPANPAKHYAVRKGNYAPAKRRKSAQGKAAPDILEAYPPGHPYRIAVHLMCGAGLRRGEAQGLTWDHVNLQQDIIHVDRQLAYHSKDDYKFAPLQARTLVRDIVIGRSLKKELAGWKDVQKEQGLLKEEKDAFVCSYPDGRTSFDTRFVESLRKKGFSPRTLRQTYEDRVDAMVESIMSRLSLEEISLLRASILHRGEGHP